MIEEIFNILNKIIEKLPTKKLSASHVFNIIFDLILAIILFFVLYKISHLKINYYIIFSSYIFMFLIFYITAYLCFTRIASLDELVANQRINKNKPINNNQFTE